MKNRVCNTFTGAGVYQEPLDFLLTEKKTLIGSTTELCGFRIFLNIVDPLVNSYGLGTQDFGAEKF